MRRRKDATARQAFYADVERELGNMPGVYRLGNSLPSAITIFSRRMKGVPFLVR